MSVFLLALNAPATQQSKLVLLFVTSAGDVLVKERVLPQHDPHILE